MRLRYIVLVSLVLAVPSVAHAATTTLACKLSKLDPASLTNKSIPVTDESEHPLTIGFASEMTSNEKTGGFRISLPSIVVNDPDNLLLAARIISAGMTSDRGMLFFAAETKNGKLIQVPVPKSAKDIGVWNAAVSIGLDKNSIFIGPCSLSGLSETAEVPSEPKQ